MPINDHAAKFWREQGITSAIVESVLPSGGRGWRLAWYLHGIEMKESVADYMVRRRKEREQPCN